MSSTNVEQQDLENAQGSLCSEEDELLRLKGLPRLTRTVTQVSGHSLEITDPYWYLHCYREILQDEIYRFNAEKADPLILDCGANIGMSVIYFKHIYPSAQVIAFEPDPDIFAVLERNIGNLELADVDLHCKAVWTSETNKFFAPDGSVGGRLVENPRGAISREVECVRLRDYLSDTIDFLKLDIEGAEVEVIEDCAPKLTNVNYLFVEYHGRSGQDQRLHEMLRVLHDRGFRYHIKEAWPVAHPFLEEERPTFYDLQLNIFAYRNLSGGRTPPRRGIASIRARLAQAFR